MVRQPPTVYAEEECTYLARVEGRFTNPGSEVSQGVETARLDNLHNIREFKLKFTLDTFVSFVEGLSEVEKERIFNQDNTMLRIRSKLNARGYVMLETNTHRCGFPMSILVAHPTKTYECLHEVDEVLRACDAKFYEPGENYTIGKSKI